MRRRRIRILLSIPVTIVALLLVAAEFANLLVVRIVVNGVRHPLVGFATLAIVLGVASSPVLIALTLLRRLPRLPGDASLLDPFYRWLNEGEGAADDAPGGAPVARTVSRRVAVVAAAALGGIVALTAFALTSASPPTQVAAHRRTPHVGKCSPAPCAVADGITLFVSAVSLHYHPTDLTAAQRAFSDGGEAPEGFRYLRLLVRFGVPAGRIAPDAPRALVLVDGSVIRRPGALAYDPACRRTAPEPAGTTPLCFLARSTATDLRLKWLPTGTTLRL